MYIFEVVFFSSRQCIKLSWS